MSSPPPRRLHRHGPYARRPRHAVHGLSPAARRRRRRLGVLLLVLVVLIVGGAAAFGGWALWRFAGVGYVFTAPQKGPVVTVTVPEGASLGQIADILAEKKVVPRAGAFEQRAERDGYARKFQPGTFRLHRYEDYAVIVVTLSKEGAIPTATVTIPEGFTAAQASRLAASRVAGVSAAEYRDLTLEHPLAAQLDGKGKETSLEGLLFPATYDFPPLKSARDLVEAQVTAFQKAFAKVDLARAKAANLTAYDVVVIASMIEREVRVPAERRLVAAVIWNRLRRAMALQIDAAVAYGLGKPGKAPTLNDLKRDTPYNTYLHTGLPPTPICNPGVASLKAAAGPAAVAYLYYVARNDGSGRHYFSRTYEQFLKDKAKAGL